MTLNENENRFKYLSEIDSQAPENTLSLDRLQNMLFQIDRIYFAYRSIQDSERIVKNNTLGILHAFERGASRLGCQNVFTERKHIDVGEDDRLQATYLREEAIRTLVQAENVDDLYRSLDLGEDDKESLRIRPETFGYLQQAIKTHLPIYNTAPASK
jgi:hypothetical protein